MAAQCCGGDFLELFSPDISACIFRRFDHPADLVRAAAVSRKWRRFVIENNLTKSLCLRLCPEVATVAAVAEVTRSPPSPAVPVSDSERDYRIYSNLAGAIFSKPRNPDIAIITHCIGASSTHKFPDETMENTLVEDDIVNFRACYWSSRGSKDPEKPESLTYRLNHDICLVNEIKVKPFEAYFQHGSPIYSSKTVRFRMGHYKLPRRSQSYVTAHDENKMVNADTNYMWTYTSPEYPMLQENVLQSFKLPRPVLCIGGVVMIELLGRVQKQQGNNRYYICVCNVQVIGCSLSPVFMVDVSNPEGHSILKYLLGAQNLYRKGLNQDDTEESPEWQCLIARYKQMNHIAVANALLGPWFMNE